MNDTDLALAHFLASRAPQSALVMRCKKYVLYDAISQGASFLNLISIEKSSGQILLLIKEFFEGLSAVEASEYLNTNDAKGENIFLLCENIEIMRIIIEYVPDINVRCNLGDNALSKIFKRNFASVSVEMVELLLDYEIDVNSVNKYGISPLMHCCSCKVHVIFFEKFRRIIKLLIEKDADVDAKSPQGLRAFDLLINPASLSEELSSLLQGRINPPKSARKL